MVTCIIAILRPVCSVIHNRKLVKIDVSAVCSQGS